MIVSPFCFNIALLWKRKAGREFNSETMLGQKSKKVSDKRESKSSGKYGEGRFSSNNIVGEGRIKNL